MNKQDLSSMYFLFDCDGTLFNTEKLKAASWGEGYFRAILTELFRNHSKITQGISSAYEAGGATKDVGKFIVKKCRTWISDEAYNIATSIYPTQLIKEREIAKDGIFDAVFPDFGTTEEAAKLIIQPVWDFVLKLKEKGLHLGLVTTTSEKWIKRYVQASGLEEYYHIDIRTLFEVAAYGKKKALGVKEAVCKAFNMFTPEEEKTSWLLDEATAEKRINQRFASLDSAKRERFLVFEDSLDAMREVKSVGLHVVAVPNDFTQNREMENVADLVIDPLKLRQTEPEQILAEVFE